MSELADRDRRVSWHPYRQHASGGEVLAVESAQGAWLTLADGRRVVDGIASWWTILHGHGHPKIVDAIARQAAHLDHVQFGSATHEPAVELAERLVELAPAGLARVFYSDDGSTAVETALKLALAYHRRRGQPRRTGLLALDHGYHGDTSAAMSVSARGPFTADYEPLLSGATRIPVPVGGRSVESCLDALELELRRRPGELAALIVEPLLMGAGGMLVTPPSFLAGLRALTAAHGVLLVADEVLTGFGRTGERFACEGAAVAPDLLCVAKALTGGILPLAATLATEEIHAAFLGDDIATAFLHGHSFTANPIGCAAALASLDLLDEAALARGRAIGERLGAGLAPLRGRDDVVEVRGVGLVRAVELRGEPAAGYLGTRGARVVARALEGGVFLRPLGNVVYALLPLCATDDEVDLVAAAIRAGVEETEG